MRGLKYILLLVSDQLLWGCVRGVPMNESSEPRARVTVADFVSRVSGLKGFVAPGELYRPAKPDELSPQDAVDRLHAAARIYNFDPKEIAFDQGTDCVADAMHELKFKATRTTLVLQGVYDDSDCLGNTNPRLKSVNSVYVAIACTGASFYSYDGKTPTASDLKALSADQLCPEGNFAILTNNVVEVTQVLPPGQSAEFVPSKKVTSTVMTKDGSACTFVVRNGLRQSLNECTEVTLETTNAAPAKTVTTYYAEKYDNLTAQLGGKFFIGGTKKVTLENWSGTVSFSGPNLAPSYEISNGAKTIKGQFASGESTAIGLRSR